MRTFIFGDIHGGLKALKQLIDKIKPTDQDDFIFLGDYVDGWSESAQVLDFLMELEKEYPCIILKGNHDVYCENWLKTGVEFGPWVSQGGQATIDSYKSYTESDKMLHIDFIQNMKLYHIDKHNNLFIHAGYSSLHGPQHERYDTNYYWDRTLWEMTIGLDTSIPDHSPRYPKRLKNFNEIFIGHTITLNYGETLPIHIANLWNIDTGAGYDGKLTALELYTKEILQSDKLTDLYPNEKGRN